MARIRCLLVLAVSGSGFGQINNSTVQPIKIGTMNVVSTTHGATIQGACTNVSGKEITAFVLVAEVLDGEKAVGRSSRMAIRGLGPSSAPKSFAPHEVFPCGMNIPVDSSGNRPAKHNLSLDYVLFGDNSRWGKDQTNSSGQVQGTIAGYRTERNRLRQLVRTRGVEALIQDLGANEEKDARTVIEKKLPNIHK